MMEGCWGHGRKHKKQESIEKIEFVVFWKQKKKEPIEQMSVFSSGSRRKQERNDIWFLYSGSRKYENIEITKLVVLWKHRKQENHIQNNVRCGLEASLLPQYIFFCQFLKSGSISKDLVFHYQLASSSRTIIY